MNKPLFAVTLSVCLLGVSVASAQQGQFAAQPGQGARGDIVLVDLKHIFENYTALTELKANLKTDVAVAENDIKARRERVTQLLGQLKQLQKGTPQHQSVEEAITKETTEINMRITQGKRKFMQQETEIIFSVYKAVLEEVAAYCRRHGVRLAMQHDGRPLNEENQAEVYQSIQHQVLYADPSLDITPVILDQLNRRHAARNVGQRR